MGKSNKKPCLATKALFTGWANLCVDAVFVVLDKLLDPIDHVRFAAVCKQWRLHGETYNRTTKRHNKVLPMLLIPSQLSESAQRGTTCGGSGTDPRRLVVYSVSEGKVYNNVSLHLQVPCNKKRICGSSHGWLATIDLTDQPFNISLINPFTTNQSIRLPPLEFTANDMVPRVGWNPHEDYVKKVILSADPNLSPENYVVVALYRMDQTIGRPPHRAFRLAVFKPGQNYWTSIDIRQLRECPVGDAVFHKGLILIYGHIDHVMMSLDVSTSDVQVKRFSVQQSVKISFRKYLVESTKGDLLHIRCCSEWNPLIPPTWPSKNKEEDGTMGFKVYKVVPGLRGHVQIVDLVEVKSIGDEALFVGDYGSVSVLASDLPSCKPNCIYYTKEKIKGKPCDMAVFNLEHKSITPVHFPHPNWPIGPVPPPIWIRPPFYGLRCGLGS